MWCAGSRRDPVRAEVGGAEVRRRHPISALLGNDSAPVGGLAEGRPEAERARVLRRSL